MLTGLKISFVLAVMLAAAAAAATPADAQRVVQNGSGTFIQDQSGEWHQYSRLRRVVPQAASAAPEQVQDALDHAKGSIY